jgi:hypothetical protein
LEVGRPGSGSMRPVAAVDDVGRDVGALRLHDDHLERPHQSLRAPSARPTSASWRGTAGPPSKPANMRGDAENPPGDQGQQGSSRGDRQAIARRRSRRCRTMPPPISAAPPAGPTGRSISTAIRNGWRRTTRRSRSSPRCAGPSARRRRRRWRSIGRRPPARRRLGCV